LPKIVLAHHDSNNLTINPNMHSVKLPLALENGQKVTVMNIIILSNQLGKKKLILFKLEKDCELQDFKMKK